MVNGEYYHIYNRSIAGFKIYNNDSDFQRFADLLGYYCFSDPPIKYSEYKRLNSESQKNMVFSLSTNDKLVSFVCFCIMPTHFHILLRQNVEDGITRFIGLIENSYSRYFNLVHKRKGPLWESRFQAVHVATDVQLLHLTRYIHLNPVSAGIINKPEEWKYSSYFEFLNMENPNNLCKFNDLIDMKSKQYQKFVNDRKDYQRQLAIIKSQLLDNYTG